MKVVGIKYTNGNDKVYWFEASKKIPESLTMGEQVAVLSAQEDLPKHLNYGVVQSIIVGTPEFIQQTIGLKPTAPVIGVITSVPMESIKTSKMSLPRQEKLYKHLDHYYNDDSDLAPIIIDENDEIIDGYCSLLILRAFKPGQLVPVIRRIKK